MCRHNSQFQIQILRIKFKNFISCLHNAQMRYIIYQNLSFIIQMKYMHDSPHVS